MSEIPETCPKCGAEPKEVWRVVMRSEWACGTRVADGKIVQYDTCRIRELEHQLAAVTAERDELRRDHDHAVSEAKRRVPDYPWTDNTASECVWALGESLLGTQAACEDWRKLCDRQMG